MNRRPSHRSNSQNWRSNEQLGKMITFEEFCNRTSLHGWKYLGDATTSQTWLLRVGWVAVVFGSMAVAAFFLGYSLNDFCSSHVQTTQTLPGK